MTGFEWMCSLFISQLSFCAFMLFRERKERRDDSLGD